MSLLFLIVLACLRVEKPEQGTPNWSKKYNALHVYAAENGYSTGLFFIVDFSLPSSEKRMYVSGSNCSSIGRYKIAEKYSGSFGRSYRLDGLDKSNSNARLRSIVLHSHSCVPDIETGLKICQSEGCPTLSPALLDRLEPLLDQEIKPVLMWMYSE